MEAVIVPGVGSGPMFRVTLYKWVGPEETEIILPIDPVRANRRGEEILKEGHEEGALGISDHLACDPVGVPLVPDQGQ